MDTTVERGMNEARRKTYLTDSPIEGATVLQL